MRHTSSLFRVLRHLRPHTFPILLSLLLAMGQVAATLYVPILVGRAIDYIVAPGNVDFSAIGRILLEVVIVTLLGALAQWCMNLCNNHITYSVVRDMRRDAFHHLQILPISYLDRHPIGDIVSRLIADIDQFADGLLMGFTQLFTGIITIAGTIGFMLSINISITLIVVLITPLSLFVAAFIARRTHTFFAAQAEARGQQTALIDEMIGGQKIVRAFGMEDGVLARFDETNETLRKTSLSAIFFSSLTNPCTRFVNAMVYAGVGVAGALVALGGGLTVGGLSCFLSYANQYTKPFNEISGVITELQNAITCVSRVFALLDETPRPADLPDAHLLSQPEGAVEMRDVSFSYTHETTLITNLNLNVRPGQRVAIVGPTGCGKTTLINLLMRFYDVNNGAISVDGHDIRTITRASLRENYGMVLQETWLKSGTIRENIAIGRPDASDEEIVSAAKSAHAHSFIRRLPDGYNTVIGEDGGSLSQGQKQLLCIARVMLCLPPMLILDEATSSIDTHTEQKIQSAFARLMEGHTSFIVAHRLSTIREADIILVMRDGQIVEQGDHQTLLAQKGFYYTLYQSQFAN